MTLSSTTNTVSYTGDASTTAFPVTYAFFGTGTSAEIEVIEVTIATGAEVTKSNGSDYTVTGGEGTTGTVIAATAPAATVKWVINRITTQTQETDYVENDPFPAESHEQALDRLTMISQEQERALGRTTQLPDGYTGSFDPTLPTSFTADSALVVNSGGDGWSIGPTTTEISNAQTYASNASTSASNAATSETNAATSASNASTSETNAATSETNAANSAAAAAASAAGIFWKEPVVNATTANITLSGEQTIDGVLTSTSRILVKNQTNAAENGVYVTASGAWARATPLDTWDEHVGAAVIVSDGTTNADTAWICTVDAGGTLETTDITWGQLSQVYSTATTSSEGITEYATAAEVTTGTDATRSITPDALAGSNYGTAVVQIFVFDDATDCATGDGAGDVFFRVPSTINGFDLVGVAAQCQTAGTTGTMDVQIHNVTQAADMLTTKITIDSAETDSSTAATAAVIDTANDDVATGDQIRIDVDAVHTTAAKGLLVELQFRLP
jgi:hypothetical protein